MAFFVSGTTIVTSSPSTNAPMNPLVLNSSTSSWFFESRCSVMPYPSVRALSLHRSTGA
jgi:hypothetical protein